jgi:hypothetical protein
MTKEQKLLDALVKAHQQVDQLLAMVIKLDQSFMPSKSPLWPEIERRSKLIWRMTHAQAVRSHSRQTD